MEITKDFIEQQLNGLKEKINTGLTEKQSELKTELLQKMDGFKTQLEGLEEKAGELETLKAAIETEKARINKLAEKKKTPEAVQKSFQKMFSEQLKENYEAVKAIERKGGSETLQLKDATINTNNSITGGAANDAGGAIINQMNKGVILPSQLVNFDDLVATVSGTEDTIRYWREAASANGIGTPASKGAVKPETTFDFDAQTETADYTAGIFRFHKSMFRNLPWMQQRLPQMLRRDFYKKQNADYHTDLAAAATAYAGSLADVEALVDAISTLEASDFAVNGIALNPADWGRIALTKDSNGAYSLPSVVSFVNGQLTVNGVPVFKASWVTADTAIVGDWTQAYKYVTDGLTIQFSEEDSDNFQKNAITSRVEECNVLVIEQPAAFINIPNLDASV